MGDDRGDLDAFDALDRLAATDEDVTVARVAVRSPESPSELLERADVVVEGPEGALSLLQALDPGGPSPDGPPNPDPPGPGPSR